MQFTFSEYFAGIGLVGMGLGEHWEMIFANDIDAKKREMYTNHFGEDARYIQSDIHALDVEDIPTTLLATASFPCVDLSLAGNREGLQGKHSSAFWGFRDVLEKMGSRRPPLLLVENVLGWLTANNGVDFRESVKALNELDYTIDAFILNAHHFTPQSRPRLFLIGALGKKAIADVELISAFEARPDALRQKRLVDSIWNNNDLKWMCLDLPDPPPIQRSVEAIVERLGKDDARWWPAEKVEHIYRQLSEMHREKVDALRQNSNITYAMVYKRVRNKQTRAEIRTDGLAGCLRTPLGGSSKQIVYNCSTMP